MGAVPFGFNDDYLGQLRSQLFNLDPKLASYNPPQPSQAEYDQALQPFAQGALKVGLGAADFAGIPATAIVNALTGHGNADQLLGASPQTAGMNSLGLPILTEMMKAQSARDLAGPTIDDVINARNELYHATGNGPGQAILNSGQINPGTGDQFTGTAMSRVPTIPEKERQLRFTIDPNGLPPSLPTADSGYGKTFSRGGSPGFYEVFSKLSDNDLGKIVKETIKKDPTFVDRGTDLNEYSMSEMSQMADSPTWQKKFRQLNTGDQPNPAFEFETRTKGQPIDVGKAVTKAIIGTGTGYDMNPMELYSQLLQSKNPVPAILMQQQQLPLARILNNIGLSRAVVGK